MLRNRISVSVFLNVFTRTGPDVKFLSKEFSVIYGDTHMSFSLDLLTWKMILIGYFILNQTCSPRINPL